MTTARRIKLPSPVEYRECLKLWEWARWAKFDWWVASKGVFWPFRVSDFLVMVPNGAYLGADPRVRAVIMGKLKATGLSPGVSDYLLALPQKDCAGLWVEMKRQDASPSDTKPEQSGFQSRMSQVGYQCVVCKGADAAIYAIETYLENPNARVSVEVFAPASTPR